MAKQDTAIVIGASIGGLLAARALSDAYANVTIIDRDSLSPAPDPRRGVPQGRQLHVLLAQGRRVLDELFPGFSTHLTDLGAVTVDLQRDVYWYNDGHLMSQAPSDLTAVGISRPLLEHAVRSRVAALPGVQFLPDCEVRGLTATADAHRVTGVRIAPAGAAESTLTADLVVDASGRASRTPIWLEEMGYARVPEQTVRVGLTYVTRHYRREPHHLGGLLGVLSSPSPDRPRAAVVAVQNDNRFAVAVVGMLGEVPPTDESMAEYADLLAAPQVADFIRSAVALDEPVLMRYPASARRRYERLRRFPDGYLVFADAMCSFNPIYGQGMTVASMEAMALRRLLADGTDRLARRFFRRAAKLIDAPWSIAVGNDLRFPQVEGRRSLRVRVTNAYISRFHAAAAVDPVLGEAFLRVLNLIDSPTRLLAPGIVRRVVFGRSDRSTRITAPRVTT